MTPEEKIAYEWALKQKFNSVAARYARTLAQYIQRIQVDTSIIGKMFFVESPNFEGIAEILAVTDSDVVSVKSDYNGAIYFVDKSCLIKETAYRCNEGVK